MVKADAIQKLSNIINQIDKIYNLDIESPEFIKWKTLTKNALIHIFSDNSSQVEEFLQVI